MIVLFVWQYFRALHRRDRDHVEIQLVRELPEVLGASFLSLPLLTHFLKSKIKTSLAFHRLIYPIRIVNHSSAQQRLRSSDYRMSIYLRFRLSPLATPNQATFPPCRCRLLHLWVDYQHPLKCKIPTFHSTAVTTVHPSLSHLSITIP